MLIICYEKSGVKHYGEWETQHDFRQDIPNTEPTYVFEKDTDIIQRKNDEANDFIQQCYNYGFYPSEYNIKFKGTDGKTYWLKGFKAKNKKYKCIAWCEDNGMTYKMHPRYVRQRIDNTSKVVNHTETITDHK